MNKVANPYDFTVRWYQRAFHEAMVDWAVKRAIAIWHRRAGKDEIVLNATRHNIYSRVGSYWHCFPEYKQARKAIWNGVNAHTGKRRIFEAFPPEIIARMNDSEMFIEFKNGSTWQLLGSDNYDSHVGAGAVQIAYSEWALCNPAAWAYHSPMVRETNGKAVFITTPRGNNHAKSMFDRAVESDSWFAELLSIHDTHALTAEQLEEALDEYITLYGLDLGRATYEQEYECSWAGAMVGAYFGAEMNRMEREGRVQSVPIDEALPVHCVMDLGKAVNNPVWLFQVFEDQLRIVDFYRPESEDLDDWCVDLRAKGFTGNTYVPHDIMVTEWGSKKTRIERLRDKKMNPKRIGRVSVADGLQAGRMAINAAVFDEEKTELGREGLKAYRREWDDELKTFRENPVKDWAEHIGSSWRYLGLAWREAPTEEQKPPPPKEQVLTVDAAGRLKSNMTTEEAIQAMIKRRMAQRR